MRTWQKSLIGVGLGVVLGPAVLSIPVTPTRAQPPSRVEVKEPVATQRTVSPAVGPRRETQVGALPEEIELLRFQVEMEGDQLHLAESRLEQAKRWESRARELAQHGDVTMEQLMVAQDGALMRQSDVVAQKAALRVAELRLCRRNGGSPASDLSPSPRSNGWRTWSDGWRRWNRRCGASGRRRNASGSTFRSRSAPPGDQKGLEPRGGAIE